MSGRLVGIGTGPGDPELLTLKAIRRARGADLVVHVHAAGRPSRARATIAPHLPPGVAELAVELAMDPERRDAEATYDLLAARLRRELDAGRDIAVLCEGDPLHFGSFLHLLDRLPEVEIDVVPGITSPTAAAAGARWPLARAAESFAVLPAPMGANALRTRLALAHRAAIIKLGRHVQAVRALLQELGLLDGAVLAVEATTENERIMPLADWSEPRAPYFALVLTPGLGGGDDEA